MEKDSFTKTVVGLTRRPPILPHALLHALALALVAFILAGGGLYLYSAYNSIVSYYRRDMNALAYDAQFYFARREVLLRSITTLIVRSQISSSNCPGTPDSMPDIATMSFSTGSDSHQQWCLISTPNIVYLLQLQNAHLLHTSTETGETRYLLFPGSGIHPQVKTWIADFLRQAPTARRADGYAPMLWLRPPGDPLSRIFIFTPLDTEHPDAGWVGFEITDVESALQTQRQHNSFRSWEHFGFALMTPNNHIVLHQGAILDMQWYERAARADNFSISWNGWIPSYLILSKALGEGGWRLVYYLPIRMVLQHPEFPLYTVAIMVCFLCALIGISVHQLRTKLLLPALRQYRELLESERLTRTIIASAPVGLCLLDRQNGKQLIANDLACHWLASESNQALRNILSQQETGYERHLSDGRSVYLNLVPMNHHGKSVMLCAINDITALKHVERSLMKANQKADAANKAKTEFVATMSHEIRTPLYGMLATLELLSLTELTPRQRQYLQSIKQSSSHLTRTINETLDFSRLESGNAQLQISEFNLTDLLNNVIASYTDRAMAKGIQLYGITDCKIPPRVEGDELRLRQILNNLVSNAIKFTTGGHVVIRLRVISRNDSHVTLGFQVADTGIGISPEHQKKLFSPYYRVDPGSSSKESSAGSGLGLYICARLAELMHASFNVISTVGLGTSINFQLTLPVGSQTSDPDLQPRSVFVHGAIPEVVHNLCEWLNQWGLRALPYQEDEEGHITSSLLICAWPPTADKVTWSGQKLVLLPPGSIPESTPDTNTNYCNAFDYHDVKQALRVLQSSVTTAQTSQSSPSISPLNIKILIVDDSVVNQRILEDQAQYLGCTPILANNGQQALKRIDEHQIDAVLTDINMPVMGGYALVRLLRERGYQGPIFGMTAGVYSEEKQRALSAGMDDLLLHPLNTQTLYDALRQAVSRKETHHD